jgi:TrmH family RNA methyltransferase
VEAALAAGCEFEGIFVEEGHHDDRAVHHVVDLARRRQIRIDTVVAGVMERVADTVTPQPICGVVRFHPRALVDLPARGTVAILHTVRDPGNTGTIVRTAEAAGVTAVIVTGPSVDPFNPKALRATAGAGFRLPIAVVSDVDDALTWAKAHGRVLATVARDGEDYHEADLTSDVTLVFGNEASGLQESVVTSCDGRVTIPMSGETESLNIAASAAVLLFAARDRRLSAGARPIIEAQ